MTPIDRLRQSLDALDVALGEAGAAWLAAEEAGADPKELKAVLNAYEVRSDTRRSWLRDAGAVLRWHRGEAPCASDPKPERDT